MKIGITCYPTYGGSGVVATELGKELAKRGHNVHFISYDMPFRLDRYHRDIRFHEVEMLEYPLFKYPPYSLSLSAKMAEIIKAEGLDIVHVHYAMPHATSAYLARQILGSNGVRVVTTLHGTDITLVGNHSSFHSITRFSIEQSDGITCVSEYLKKTTQDTFGIKKDMEVIYNFVDTGEYKRNGNGMNAEFLEKDEKVISHVSNFRPVKRIDIIVKIFSNIIKKVNCRLLLAGDGPEMSNIRRLVETIGLGDKVVFLGKQEDIIPLLNISDIYMLPSDSESFGLSALEAMSCGVPVIGTSVGGLKEVVEDGISGFIDDPSDISKMSSDAISILTSSKKHRDMGKAARKRAMEFDSSLMVKKYIKYYEKVLGS